MLMAILKMQKETKYEQGWIVQFIFFSACTAKWCDNETVLSRESLFVSETPFISRRRES